MARYLGQKVVNWPAATLIFGWMLIGGAYSFGASAWVSSFPRALPGPPLLWWTEMSFPGFVLTGAPFLLGGLSLWLVPAMDYSARLSAALIALGVVLFMAGVVWDSGAGVALYSDRVVHRDAGFGRPLRTEPLAEIRRVETSCAVSRRRGSTFITPSYELVFSSGTRIDIWEGFAEASTPAADRLGLVRIADDAATQAGAIRGPRRKPDGSLVGTRGCLRRLAEQLGAPLDDVEALFTVDRSQLRPGEYTVTSAP